MPNLGKRLMQSRSYLLLAVMLLSGSALFVPPLIWAAAVLVGLSTLVLGPNVGFTALSFAALPIAGFVLANGFYQVLLYLLLNVSIVWLLSVILRVTRSWNLVLSALVGCGALMVLGVLYYLPEVFQSLVGAVETFIQNANQAKTMTVDIAISSNMMLFLGHVSLGYYVFDFMLSAMVATLCARAWQAKLYNPGGLADEFSKLKPDRTALVFLLMVVFALFLQNMLAVSLVPAVMFPFVFYGFSAVQRKMGRAPNRRVAYGFYALGCVFSLYMVLPGLFLSVVVA